MGLDGRRAADDRLDRAVEAALGANVPILVGGTRWECPTCGSKPPNVQPGVPEAVCTKLSEDDAQYHCGPCLARWQAEEQVRRIRENVPALRPVVV